MMTTGSSAGGVGRLAGETALVTGGWRGIGAAVCRGYAAEDARVAVNFPPANDAARAGAHRLVEELAAMGHAAIAVEGDVADQQAVQRMVGQVESELGPVSVLVANAAASSRAPWTEIDLPSWNHVMAVNVTGALLCAQAVHPRMRQDGHGKIITVSSVMVQLGSEHALHYVTSKAALIGLTRALSREVGRDGICVNAVMPGAIRTESEAELSAEDPDVIAVRQAKLQSIPRRGYAEDLTGAFVFLASRESDFMTGQVLAVDGGWIHY
jgi:3-oxoacyl-[acyl-carrier protein] reductase